MFKKKNCKRCGNKINDKYDFCPYCGNPLNENFKEDWGMLGRSDFPEDDVDMFSNSLFNSINSGILGKMLGNAIKMLEREMQKANKEPLRKTDFKLYINGKRINPKNIRVVQKGEYRKDADIEKIPKVSLSKEKIKKFSNLPKTEPSSNMKRLSDDLVCEIDVPGVESINDVIISRLENSIEIKALAKDKVYSKLIPVNLPIKRCNLFKDKLTIHLDTK